MIDNAVYVIKLSHKYSRSQSQHTIVPLNIVQIMERFHCNHMIYNYWVFYFRERWSIISVDLVCLQPSVPTVFHWLPPTVSDLLQPQGCRQPISTLQKDVDVWKVANCVWNLGAHFLFLLVYVEITQRLSLCKKLRTRISQGEREREIKFYDIRERERKREKERERVDEWMNVCVWDSRCFSVSKQWEV